MDPEAERAKRAKRAERAERAERAKIADARNIIKLWLQEGIFTKEEADVAMKKLDNELLGWSDGSFRDIEERTRRDEEWRSGWEGGTMAVKQARTFSPADSELPAGWYKRVNSSTPLQYVDEGTHEKRTIHTGETYYTDTQQGDWTQITDEFPTRPTQSQIDAMGGGRKSKSKRRKSKRRKSKRRKSKRRKSKRRKSIKRRRR